MQKSTLRTLSRGLMVALALLVTASLPVKADDSLYQALGAQSGLEKIVHLTIKKSLANPRIKHTFADSNIPRVEKLIVQQFCDLSGGPCEYKGKPMHKSHKGLKISTMEFNALVEDLQDAMDEVGVPFSTQNRLLALLAPMKRDIVTR